MGHFGRVGSQLREQIGCEHEDWCSRWMAYFQLVSSKDEFGTVPKAGCRLHRETVDNGRQDKDESCHQGVDFRKCSLFHYALLIFSAKLTGKAGNTGKGCLTFV